MNMFFPQPSVAEERADAVRSRAQAWEGDHFITADQRRAIDSALPSPWKHSGLILGAVFFVLTLIGVAALFWLFDLANAAKGVWTAIVAIAAAELLIHRAHFFGTGIESALWIGGLFAFIFGLPSEGKPEALLVFAAAAAIAGARVRNPIFGGLATVLVVAYAAVKSADWWPPVLVALAIAFAAAVALRRERHRPSNELLFALMTVIMPPAGYIAALSEKRAFQYDMAATMNDRAQTIVPFADVSLAVIFAIAGLLLGVLAIPRRDRATLIAAALSIGISAYEVRKLLRWPVEAQLIVGGGLVVALSWILARILRGRTRGFVITPTALTRYDEAMQIAGAIAVAPPSHAPAAAPHRESGGGSFGGAGSSGDF